MGRCDMQVFSARSKRKNLEIPIIKNFCAAECMFLTLQVTFPIFQQSVPRMFRLKFSSWLNFDTILYWRSVKLADPIKITFIFFSS